MSTLDIIRQRKLREQKLKEAQVAFTKMASKCAPCVCR